jgi:hypothetical protein
MKTPGIVWVVMAAGCFLPSLGRAEISGAKAIFASGEGPTVLVETPDSSVPLHNARPPVKAKTHIAKQTAAEQEQYVGFSYWVEVTGSDGEQKRVTAEQVFRSGDRIRLHMMSNWDGYLYVVNLDSTGRSQLLSPHPAGSEGNHLIRAHTRYEIPPSAYIRFDDNPGEQTIVVMLSPTPLWGIAPSPSPQMQPLSKVDTERLAVMAYLKGAKDWLLEVDTTSSQPASYVVAPLSMLESSGQMISLQVKLKHQ